jgi:hypothetical protein
VYFLATRQTSESDRRYIGILALALSVGFAGVAVHRSPASAAEPLSADTRLTTTGGATFTAPIGWRVTSATNKTVLDPPEADSHLVLLDVQATDTASAVAAGWAQLPSRREPAAQDFDATDTVQWLRAASSLLL